MRDLIGLVEGIWDEDVPPTLLYHGTIVENLKGIDLMGLQASVGEFVTHAYGLSDGEDDEDEDAGMRVSDVEELVFLADAKGLTSCIAAIAHLIKIKFGGDGFDKELMRQHGALCVVEADLANFDRRPGRDEDERDDGDHPYAVEPGDYYSRYSVQVDRVMVGDEMIAFFDQHGAHIQGGRYSMWNR